MSFLEVVPLRGEKISSPQSRILISLRVLFKISDEHPCHFYMGVPLLGACPGGMLAKRVHFPLDSELS